MPHVNPIQIQKFLKGVDYPARKETLIENARKLGADEAVFASLEQLPDEEFETPASVSKAFGELPDEVITGGGEAAARAGREGVAARQQQAGEGRHEKTAGAQNEKGAEARSEKAGGKGQRETGDNEFLAQALQDTLAEVQTSELAIERSSNERIKAFAQTMIDEHGQMGRDLEKLAGKKKIDLPTALRGEQESTMKTLSKLQGDKFDAAYIEQIIKDHENDIKVFKHYASAALDEDAKEFARQGEKMLTRHLKMIKEIDKKH